MKKNEETFRKLGISIAELWSADDSACYELTKTNDPNDAVEIFRSCDMDSPEENMAVSKWIELSTNLFQIKSACLTILASSRLVKSFAKPAILKWLKLAESYEDAKEAYCLCVNSDNKEINEMKNNCLYAMARLSKLFEQSMYTYHRWVNGDRSDHQLRLAALTSLSRTAANLEQTKIALEFVIRGSSEHKMCVKKIIKFSK